jgi:hypothetical protein
MEFRRRPDLAASKEVDSLSNFRTEAVMSRESQMLADFQPCARLQHDSQIVGVTPSRYRRNRSPYLLHRSPFANEYPQKERFDEAP